MNLYVKNNRFWFELENLTRLFFPNEKINVYKEFSEVKPPYVFSELSDKITVKVQINDFFAEDEAEIKNDDTLDELSTVSMLYKMLRDYSQISQPWGLLTGVRPVKLLRKISEESDIDSAVSRFTNDFFVSEQKAELARITEQNERKILSLSKPESFSLYVGIPFCPSRCSYCSFVMASIERAKKLIEPYVDLLCEELKATAKAAKDLGLRLESVYFGGGTPTTLSAEQLNRVLSVVNSEFDMSTCREFTVEAGRPDTITRDKLISLKENNVGRISINPQSVNDEVLKAIGRKHTAEQFYQAFDLARKCGFDNINTDLIAGLPSDTVESFQTSLDSMIDLNAECITVHTLCMKRASNLTQDGKIIDREPKQAYLRKLYSVLSIPPDANGRQSRKRRLVKARLRELVQRLCNGRNPHNTRLRLGRSDKTQKQQYRLPQKSVQF